MLGQAAVRQGDCQLGGISAAGCLAQGLLVESLARGRDMGRLVEVVEVLDFINGRDVAHVGHLPGDRRCRDDEEGDKRKERRDPVSLNSPPSVSLRVGTSTRLGDPRQQRAGRRRTCRVYPSTTWLHDVVPSVSDRTASPAPEDRPVAAS